MDPKDMAKLGVGNWESVLVKTDWGEVVVYAAHSRDAPHENMIFIPKGTMGKCSCQSGNLLL